ncbi:Transcription initiation factor TFIID subunit 8 isoform 1 [Dorcoceras hygrometricum]|uniref:Transcription initiation factor TFIID subunit 8 isoform 1 n=1 Tax=Dorcoceras hygrometricum TaxID=472368 RepID=A0A2Z7AQW1_9LAMI|nr:Transcription initiation factor TFIID subunit 8 isoform 1 [Dorcoceras hygrometricum]
MALMGDDGRGYELARKLESHGVWRSWLGDAVYSNFVHFLSSPASWDAFMRSNDSKTKSQIQLQLRARALLYDKASVSLFLQSHQPPAVSKLNPIYLELHGDDVYFTLENGAQDGDQPRHGIAARNLPPSKGQCKGSLSTAGTRYSESEVDTVSQRFKFEEFPETWYTQFFDKYKTSKSYRSLLGDRELEKRTPEQMASYLRVVENHKRRRTAFNDAPSLLSNLVTVESNTADETLFFPETMFTLNCVPDGVIMQRSGLDNNQKVQFNGVLDNLPQTMSKSAVISPIMIERLGIRPEYLNMEQGGNQTPGKNGSQASKKLLGHEEASHMSQKVVAQVLVNVGFESSTEAPLDVLSQFLSCHINKLGRVLKLLADSYRKQCSAIELLKMFLQMSENSNLGALAELVKDNTKHVVHQTQQPMLGMQAQLPAHQQIPFQQTQQILRQMNPQMQQINNPNFLAFQQQQQWERMRRRQAATPRPSMNTNMDKDRPVMQVKMEAPSDFPLDTNVLTAMNSRHPQLQQLRQQQLAAISSLHAQANNPCRPMTTLQIPQIQSPNVGVPRAQPVNG